jgi:hypothetical protein
MVFHLHILFYICCRIRLKTLPGISALNPEIIKQPMKLLTLIVFIVIISFPHFGCQKEFQLTDGDTSVITPPGGPGGSGSGTFTATIDGVAFVADKVAVATKAIGVIALVGQNKAGEQILLRVADSSVHNYIFDINSTANVAAYSKDTAYAYGTNGGLTADQSGGVMSITFIDTVKKLMSGTFSIKVYRQYDNKQKIITNGVFKNISYDTAPIQQANALDTFRVKVDGSAFPTYAISNFLYGNTINISASDKNVSRTVGFSFSSSTTPGTYDLATGFDYIATYNAGTDYMMAESGSLTILENNAATKRLRANFSFKAFSILSSTKVSLTEGYFSIKLK